MILEKDKVYKIKHKNIDTIGWRNYIICSPLTNVNTDILPWFSQRSGRYVEFSCHFIICFDGAIIYKSKTASSAFFESCKILPLNEKDLLEVKEAVKKMGVKYNRKLNKLVL